jgi:hypothetical protein
MKMHSYAPYLIRSFSAQLAEESVFTIQILIRVASEKDKNLNKKIITKYAEFTFNCIRLF